MAKLVKLGDGSSAEIRPVHVILVILERSRICQPRSQWLGLTNRGRDITALCDVTKLHCFSVTSPPGLKWGTHSHPLPRSYGICFTLMRSGLPWNADCLGGGGDPLEKHAPVIQQINSSELSAPGFNRGGARQLHVWKQNWIAELLSPLLLRLKLLREWCKQKSETLIECVCLHVCLCVCLTHKYNPNVSEFGFFPDPKTGEGAGVHAVQKLGYAVLNVAVQRLSQEEVKLMCSTHTRMLTHEHLCNCL